MTLYNKRYVIYNQHGYSQYRRAPIYWYFIATRHPFNCHQLLLTLYSHSLAWCISGIRHTFVWRSTVTSLLSFVTPRFGVIVLSSYDVPLPFVTPHCGIYCHLSPLDLAFHRHPSIWSSIVIRNLLIWCFTVHPWSDDHCYSSLLGLTFCRHPLVWRSIVIRYSSVWRSAVTPWSDVLLSFVTPRSDTLPSPLGLMFYCHSSLLGLTLCRHPLVWWSIVIRHSSVWRSVVTPWSDGLLSFVTPRSDVLPSHLGRIFYCHLSLLGLTFCCRIFNCHLSLLGLTFCCRIFYCHSSLPGLTFCCRIFYCHSSLPGLTFCCRIFYCHSSLLGLTFCRQPLDWCSIIIRHLSVWSYTVIGPTNLFGAVALNCMVSKQIYYL
jgi:hypothetical protein